jgi:predicted transcriptional regulator
MLQTFTTYGWVTARNGKQHLTSAGRRALDAYDDLALTIEQVAEKAVWLQRLNPERVDFPVHALTDAEIIASGPHSPGMVLGAALKLWDPHLSRFRTLTSIFNPTLFTAYNKLLWLGLQGEAIVDQSVYTELHKENMEYFLDNSEFGGFQILRLEESLTLGIGLYDDRKVAVGTYNETGEGDHIAMLLSSNDALVEWGRDLYNSYRRRAYHALDRPENHKLDSPAK